MITGFQYDRMTRLLQHTLSEFSNGAIITPEGDSIFIKYQSLTDIGTFPSTAHTSNQYLQLKDGDVVVTNDPYSGGSTLFSLNLIMAAEPKSKKGKSSPLLITVKIDFKPKLAGAKTLDEEGLRIPPTPIRQNGQLNLAIVEAMSAHPLAPENLQERLSEAVEKLNRARTRLLHFSSRLGTDWSKANLKKYLKASKQNTLKVMHDLANGEKQLDVKLKSGANIRLRTEILEDKVTFDFSGTDTPKEWSLTDSATFGACAGGLISVFQENVPLNSGTFELIDLVAPQGSIVNAKFPLPTFEGMTDGVAVLANLVVKAIGAIDSNKQVALSSASQCAFDLEFDSNCHFFETLKGGAPGSHRQKGTDALPLWRRTDRTPSLEEIEARYPLTLKTYSFRPKSGGSGEYQGGNGVTKTVQVSKECTLRWVINEPVARPEGAQGGKAASSAEMVLMREGGKREKLDDRGELKLQPGDSITMNSAGGGGFGDSD